MPYLEEIATLGIFFFSATSTVVPLWIQDVLQSYNTDSFVQELLPHLMVNPSSKPPFQLFNGILKFKSRIYIGADNILKHKLLSTLHSSAIGGHSGISATYTKLNLSTVQDKINSLFGSFITFTNSSSSLTSHFHRFCGTIA